MAIAPPTMAVPSGRLKEALDIMELLKKRPAAILEQGGLHPGGRDGPSEDRARAERRAARGRIHP
jgi:hypothetical protein